MAAHQNATSQLVALVVYGADEARRASQLLAAPVYTADRPAIRSSQLYGLAVYAPDQVEYVKASQLYALVPYTLDVYAIPHNSQVTELVVWGTNTGGAARSRAWTFTLDGHVFYVLDLGQEGTFLYDMTTKEWCQFITEGHEGWNIRNGVVWGSGRIAGADSTDALVWELDPSAVLDDGFRDIEHVVTGGVTTRSRVYHSVEALRIAGSLGAIDQDSGAFFTMKFSDDNGNTWSDDFTVELVQNDFDGEIAWTSLGSFMAPGRVFEFTDMGGLLRIDGADIYIENFDGAGDAQQ